MSASLDEANENAFQYQGLDSRRPWLRDIFRGMLLGFVLVAAAVLSIALLGGYHLSLMPGAHLKAVVLCVWVLATAAMLEEVMFRGYPFQRLVESLGTLPAITIVTLFFGAVHLRNPHSTRLGALNTVLVGVLFAMAYLRTRMLWLPFGIHFAWNLTMGLIFGLPVSGMTMFSVLAVGFADGPTWLTGGPYGIEGSLTGTGVIAIGIFVLAIMPPRSLAAESQVAATGRRSI